MSQRQPEDFACYYGPARLPQLARYDLVILEPGHYARRDVQSLRVAGVSTVAYLSIGQEPAPGGGDWRLVDPETKHYVRVDRWNTLMVDCRSEAWQRELLDRRIPSILERGFDGLLLDNVDVQETYPDTRPGVAGLILRIRAAYPGLVLLTNRGFSVLETVSLAVDGVLFEAFTTYHDGKRYRAWDPSQLAWTEAQCQRLAGLSPSPYVLALDYADPHDPALRGRARARAREHGYPSFVTTWNLDWLPARAPRDNRRAP